MAPLSAVRSQHRLWLQLAKLMSQSRLLVVHLFVTLEALPLFSLKENGMPVSDGLYLGVTWTINKQTH